MTKAINHFCLFDAGPQKLELDQVLNSSRTYTIQTEGEGSLNARSPRLIVAKPS